ncbi:MAG: hypothetical protein U0931_12830 [Vulcanimicrobiota bacterium]
MFLARSPGSVRGLSLAETVVGLFVVTCGVLCSFQLLQVSTRYGTQVDMKVAATRIAERNLAEVRAWARARSGNVYHFEDHPVWTARYNGGWAPDRVDPKFMVQIRNHVYQLDSPNSTLESTFPDDRRKHMTESFHKVQVDVSWGNDPNQRATLVSLVGAPARPIGRLSETFTTRFQTSPLNYKERVEVEASLLDAFGNPIPDVMFSHYVRSVSRPGVLAGNGILDSTVSPRTGKRATLLHNYPGYGRNWFSAHGQVLLQVICRYRGLQRRALSGYVDLLP